MVMSSISNKVEAINLQWNFMPKLLAVKKSQIPVSNVCTTSKVFLGFASKKLNKVPIKNWNKSNFRQNLSDWWIMYQQQVIGWKDLICQWGIISWAGEKEE